MENETKKLKRGVCVKSGKKLFKKYIPISLLKTMINPDGICEEEAPEPAQFSDKKGLPKK